LEPDLLHPLLKGSVHIRRWVPDDTRQVVLFPYRRSKAGWGLIPAGVLETKFPKTWRYLLRCRAILSERERGNFEGDSWYGYVYPKNLATMSEPKILTPCMARRGEFCLDDNGDFYFVGSGGGGGGGYGISLPDGVSPHLLLGLLNSQLLDWFLKQITTRFHSGWYAYNKQYIEQLPIKLPQTAAERKLAKQISQRVQRIIDLKKRLTDDRLGEHERIRLERDIEADEKAIDNLVCRLYGVDSIPV
jgi:hypothetical protein